KSFGILADAKDNAKDHPEAYKIILKGIEGNTATKRLAAQFTTRFFKHFPDLAESAINAVLDLCEDEDSSIRKAAIKELPNLCKGNKEHVSRLADVLVQLLVSDESSEVSVATIALNGLFSFDAKGTLTGILSQILSGDDEVRQKAITYMCSRLKSASEAELNKETEEYVLAELKKVLEDVTGDEFQLLIQALSNLHHLQTIQGRQQLVNIIAEQLKLDEDFDAKDSDSINRITDLCAHCGANEVQNSILPLFNSLINYMPLPPSDELDSGSAATNLKLQFSYVECLMHAFHQLGKHKPDFFTADDAAARLKDFRIRLQYFARGVQVYIKELKTSLAGKSPNELRTDKENQIKLIALKTCNNINSLIRDLFHNPPAYKATINASWKKPAGVMLCVLNPVPTFRAQKRSSTGGDDADDKKKDRTLYRTPGGKYSSNISGEF
uniref:Apoptosis inhibitor 5 n=1 Tax=Ciona savignyi TaxID=51511 RepID=H2ZJL7_CIOSA